MMLTKMKTWIKQLIASIVALLALWGLASLGNPVPETPELTDKISYPVEITQDIEKLEYTYRSQEKLRLEHNEMGRKFREGKITKNEWEVYKETDFNPKSQIISEEIGLYRDDIWRDLLRVQELDARNVTHTDFIDQKKTEFKNSTTWVVDLKSIQK